VKANASELFECSYFEQAHRITINLKAFAVSSNDQDAEPAV